MLQYVFQGLGVCLGVVVGVIVTLVVQWWVRRRYREQRKSNLKFELKLDTKKLGVWLKDLTTLKSAIAGDSLSTYHWYFDLSRAVFVTTNNMFLSGELYDLLTDDEIGDLQVVVPGLSYNSENFLNTQINQDKLAYAKAREEGDNHAILEAKQNAGEHVDEWQTTFEWYKKILESIASKL